MPELVVKNLTVSAADSAQALVEQVNFTLEPGRRLGIIGGSGAGKTLLARAMSGFLAAHLALQGGVRLGDKWLPLESRGLHRSEFTRHATIIWQQSIGGLNPCQHIGHQLAETLRLHQQLSKASARSLALEWLHRVGIDKPAAVAKQYPHQLSGGMSQRVSLSLGLCGGQPIVIADEPTTALDSVRQRECIELIDQLCAADNRTLVFITHDLALAAELCDELLVLSAGKVVDHGSSENVLHQPTSSVTAELVQRYRRIRACLEAKT